jgi:ABC-2 type transport system ATP-binding protein
VTVIVSTAYLDEAERCDRIALFHKGKVAVIERPDELQRRLHDQVLAVRTDQPRRARELLREHPVVRQAVLFGDVVHVTLAGGAADWPRVRDHLSGRGIAIVGENPVEPSLEDVFIDLVQGREAENG